MNTERVFINKDKTLYSEFIKNKKKENTLNIRIDKIESAIQQLSLQISAIEEKISRIGENK